MTTRQQMERSLQVVVARVATVGATAAAGHPPSRHAVKFLHNSARNNLEGRHPFTAIHETATSRNANYRHKWVRRQVLDQPPGRCKRVTHTTLERQLEHSTHYHALCFADSQAHTLGDHQRRGAGGRAMARLGLHAAALSRRVTSAGQAC